LRRRVARKLDSITDAGRRFLREHRDIIINEIVDRVKEGVDEPWVATRTR
jgi:hypothetical protein